MKSKKPISMALFAPIFVFCLGIAAVAQSYNGQATAAKVTITAPLVSPVTTAVADTGPLPSAGGNITLSSAGTSVSGVLSVGSSNVSTSGSSSVSQSTASVNTININVLGNTITADVVSATTNCSCPAAACSGSTSITNLVINGSPTTVTGSVNQTVALPAGVGNVLINEHISDGNSETVNAIHIFVTAVDTTTTDIIVASARSGIDCGVMPPPPHLFSGYGRSVDVTQTIVTPSVFLSSIIADTGWLPSSGGVITATTAGAGVSTLVTTSAATSSTSGGPDGGNINTTQSDSEVDQLGINALSGAVVIGATVVKSNTQCSCSLGVPTCSGSAVLTNLSVQVSGSAVPITITGSPNQVQTIPVGVLGFITLTINEQISSGADNFTVNALRVDMNLTGLAATSVIISAAHSGISCAIIPTAAHASVSGKVVDNKGHGLNRSAVTAIDSDGETYNTMTNSAGLYRLDGLTAGTTYIVTVDHKAYTFKPRVINLQDDMTEVDFAPLRKGNSK